MALLTIAEVTPTIELFHTVDPNNIVDVNVSNNTGEVFELTFVTTQTKGKIVTIVPDATVPIPVCRPGEDITITAQMINDALAAGNKTDIYRVSKRENVISTVPKFNYTFDGQTVAPSKSKKK